MDARLKQRLVGAAVLIALAVIFLPMLVKGPAPDSGVSDLTLRVPDAPEGEFRTIDLPLTTPADAPAAGVLETPPAAARADADAAPAAGEGDAAEPLPATVAAGDYAVHFGAFASAPDADAVLRQIRDEARLEGYSEPFELNGKPAHRVRLGPYATRAEAETVRLRAARLRSDVNPRVVALDAERAPPPVAAASTPAPAAQAATPAPESRPARAATTRRDPQPSAASPAASTRSDPQPTTAPPAPTTAAAGVGFVVQLGAFSKPADATALRDRLRAQGITAFTDTVDTDKGRLTRVKAGPVTTRADADRLKVQVKAKVGIDGIVRPHP